MRNIFVFIVLGCTIWSCQTTPVTSSPVNTVAELRSFLDDYAVLLRKRDMDGIANLYQRDSTVMSFNGYTELATFDSIRSSYQQQSREPVEFGWRNVRVDPMGNDHALVTAAFFWYRKEASDTTKFAYTGVFVKTGEGWRIMHEHESGGCK